MTQAGLNKITLFENRDLSINYTTHAIATAGQVIELPDFATLDIDPNAIVINYSISAQILDLQPVELASLTQSIYGWIAKFDFLDNTTKIIERAFIKPELSELDNNTSNSRTFELISWNRQGLIKFD
jgi:hypothetical protein